MNSGEVADRLAAMPLFADVARDELEWLVARGDVREYAADTILLDVGAAIDEMFVVLTGRAALFMDKGGVWRRVTESGPGKVHGAVPYSRGRTSVGRLAIEEDATLFNFPRSHFTDLT